MRWLAFGLIALLAPAAAAAQSFPQCGPTVAIGAGPAASDVMRQLRCTIAVLDQERMTAVDAETQGRVALAMAQADAGSAEGKIAGAEADAKQAKAALAKDEATIKDLRRRLAVAERMAAETRR
jgi:hypothetical protein